MTVVQAQLRRARDGAVLQEVTIAPDGGFVQLNDEPVDGGIHIELRVIDPVVPAPPPRELVSMSTDEVAEYLAKRIRDEREDARWEAMGEDL